MQSLSKGKPVLKVSNWFPTEYNLILLFLKNTFQARECSATSTAFMETEASSSHLSLYGIH